MIPITDPTLLVGINEIVERAQHQIEELAGVKVSVRIMVHQKEVSKQDLLKLIIQDRVCAFFKVTFADLLKRNRERPKVDARTVYAYYMHNIANVSKMEISKELKLDHTSIIHLINRFAELYSIKDPVIMAASQFVNEILINHEDKAKA